MTRRIVVEFSLVDESKEKSSSELLNDVKEALKNDVTVPWCGKVLDIQISS